MLSRVLRHTGRQAGSVVGVGIRRLVHTQGRVDVSVPSAVVEPEWVAAHARNDGVAVLDCSWFMPAEERDCAREYASKHVDVPHTAFVDLDSVCDHSSKLPHMLPSPTEFASAMSSVGITNDHTVIVYDTSGLFSAPRMWWTFRALGHAADKVAVMNGGLPAWEAQGHGTTSGAASFPSSAAAAYTPGAVQDELVVHLDEMRGHVSAACAGQCRIVDARPEPRFQGTEPDPREGIVSGHMPGASCLPFGTLREPIVDGADGAEVGWRLKSPSELAAALGDVSSFTVSTCGSGVTACVISLAHAAATDGFTPLPVYDGAWSEWGQLGLDVPVNCECTVCVCGRVPSDQEG